jgi:hypothetical protein
MTSNYYPWVVGEGGEKKHSKIFKYCHNFIYFPSKATHNKLVVLLVVLEFKTSKLSVNNIQGMSLYDWVNKNLMYYI